MEDHNNHSRTHDEAIMPVNESEEIFERNETVDNSYIEVETTVFMYILENLLGQMLLCDNCNFDCMCKEELVIHAVMEKLNCDPSERTEETLSNIKCT